MAMEIAGLAIGGMGHWPSGWRSPSRAAARSGATPGAPRRRAAGRTEEHAAYGRIGAKRAPARATDGTGGGGPLAAAAAEAAADGGHAPPITNPATAAPASAAPRWRRRCERQSVSCAISPRSFSTETPSSARLDSIEARIWLGCAGASARPWPPPGADRLELAGGRGSP